MRGRSLTAVWLLGVSAALAAALLLLVVRPWGATAAPGELTVERATLRPGAIVLEVTNGSEEPATVAQANVSDAYVDFRPSGRVLSPERLQRFTIFYPWVQGESYDIELLLSSGEAIEYELEEAEAGNRSAEGS